MALENHTQQVPTHVCDSNESYGSSLKSNLDSISSKIDDDLDDHESNNNSGGFDCNICLDSVVDPVVTICGHLYCWPCIYKWIHCQTNSSGKSNHQQPRCPVCKLDISERTLIPLYGPGSSTRSTDLKTEGIPQRPPSPKCSAITNVDLHPAQQNQNQNAGSFMSSLVSHPNVGMYGEMVYARIFGNSQAALYTYHPNSYHHIAANATPRVRRRIMEVDRSFNRLCFFLFCCMILCLLLF